MQTCRLSRAAALIETMSARQAYIRLSSQIYNGGIEQLYANEGDDLERVKEIARAANGFASKSKSWPAAKALLWSLIHNFEDLEDRGSHMPGDSPNWEDDENGEDMYVPLCDLLHQVDIDTGVDAEKAAVGDPFGIDKEMHAGVAAPRPATRW